MQLHEKQQEILLRKIELRKEEIKKHMISNITPITDIVLRETPDFESYADAMKIDAYKPVKVGDMWGGGKNAWFRVRFTVPAEFKGKEVAAYFDIKGEGCVWIDGKPYQGIDQNHSEVVLLKSARGGEKFELIIDAVSGIWWEHDVQDKAKFARAEIATRNSDVREYFYNLDVLVCLAKSLDIKSPRRAKITYLLNKSVDAFDYDNIDDITLAKSVKAANAILQPLLDCKAVPSATNVAVHGHSHIDVAWLWPYRETFRKCSRTFSTVMRMMEQYPDYLFSQSQAQLYEFTKTHFPALYEDIKARVKEGRWDVMGSMWVEADCNICSGESLTRQILVGKNYFKDEFGITTDVLWLPDVFGYSAALPQILKKAGVPYFSTIKISWSQFNKFPYNTFHWTGIDGTQVLAHFPPTGDYNATPGVITQQAENFAEKDRSDWSLLSYGWGDGGGGPEPMHMEYLNRMKDLEGFPRAQQTKVSDFFHTIDGTPDLPEWVGELYLELHRGTYTTQGKNKWYNRKCELLYRDAELMASITAPMGVEYPYEELATEWKRILVNQFHDVIPGSSVRAVYEDTDIMYPEIMAVGNKVVDQSVSKLAEKVDTTGEGDAILVTNTLAWGRTDVASAKLPAKGDYAVIDVNGNEVASQVDGDLVQFNAMVPSMGYSTYRLAKRKSTIESEMSVSKTSLENGFYKIELDSNGLITSLIEKNSGREVVPEGDTLNLLQLFEDKPHDWPAWDIDFYYEDKFTNLTAFDSIEIVNNGPVSAGIEIVRSFGGSKIKQKILIYSNTPRIDFITWVDWHENNKCLKAYFPVDVNASKARYEIQFGNVERPTHRNTGWDFARFEVAGQKWADVSEAGFGLSLMNDSKYGHSARNNAISLTLLRSPKEPDKMADMGEHNFTYSIMPHGGDYAEAGTVRRAFELNVPLLASVVKSSTGEMPAEKSFIACDSENVVIDTVKRAEKENTTIIRLYECHNTRGPVTVKVDLPFEKVYECGIMEDNIAEVPCTNGEFVFEIKPFEIKTFKLA